MEFVRECGSEETVVILIISRVLFAFCYECLSAFIYEALGLVLVTASAFLLETFGKQRAFQHLKTRPGTESGIMLGSVTWPIVFASHLLLCLQTGCKQEIARSDIERVQRQFWISIACSIQFLYIMARDLLPNNALKRRSCIDKEKQVEADSNRMRLRYLRLMNGLAFLFCFLSLSSSLSGLSGVLAVTIGFLQVWGCGTLFYYIFSRFPACATPGEAVLTAEGLTLYVGNAALNGISKVLSLHMPSLSSNLLEHAGDDVDAILQALLLALLLVPSLYGVLNESMAYQGRDSDVIGKDLMKRGDLFKMLHFLVVLGFTVWVLAPLWLYLVGGLQQHLFLGILDLVLEQPFQRLTLCGYWLIILGITLIYIYKSAKKGKTHMIIVRKYYHLVAVVMFVPALLFQPRFLRLAFGVALAAFLVAEMVRTLGIPPLGAIVHKFMKAFTDERDSDLLIISHFSLLLGCAVPLWLNMRHDDRPLASFSGILSLGIGDTMKRPWKARWQEYHQYWWHAF